MGENSVSLGTSNYLDSCREETPTRAVVSVVWPLPVLHVEALCSTKNDSGVSCIEQLNGLACMRA